jgi:sugar/nucleoside kinase (ribokinase family)
MTKKFDVLIAGSYTLDLVFTGLPALPELGAEVISSGFEMLPGEAFNSAAAMHRLGLKVAWAGDFGSDEFSRFTLERVREEGMEESLFVHHDRPLRRVSVAASFPNDRAFITYYDPEPGYPAALKALATVSARSLYVPGFYCGPLFDMGVKLARLKRMKVIMDGNSGEGVSLTDKAVHKTVKNVDLILPNAREARCLTGETDIYQALRKLGQLCPLVVIKDGEQGSYAVSQGEIIHVPAIQVSPIDTTGAGDCFNAGFIKAWLGDLPLETCLRWGNVVGGLSTLALGGTGKKITVEEINHWLNGNNL